MADFTYNSSDDGDYITGDDDDLFTEFCHRKSYDAGRVAAILKRVGG